MWKTLIPYVFVPLGDDFFWGPRFPVVKAVCQRGCLDMLAPGVAKRVFSASVSRAGPVKLVARFLDIKGLFLTNESSMLRIVAKQRGTFVNGHSGV